MEKQKNLNCLFIYDNKFKIKDNKVYSAGGINDKLFKRYVLSSENIVVINRMEKVDSCKGLSQITSGNIIFAPVKGLVFSKVFSIYFIPNMQLFIKEFKKADFVVVRLPSFLGVFALVVNIGFKKKYFLEVAGDAKEALLTSKMNPSIPFKIFIYVFFELNKYFIKSANGVIYVTQDMLQEKYPTNGLTAHASNVDIDIQSRELNIDNYRCSNKFFKIGLIGSFNNHYKGITEAINAISFLKNRQVSVELRILGSGTLKSYYQSLAKDKGVNDLVFFDGIRKGGEEVSEWLESLDLYIQPSYTEGLPRALIEAMSVGLPAVASNVGGISELLSEESLVKPYDSKALAEKIEVLVDSQQLRFKHGRLNYQKSKNYDKDILVKRRSDFWAAARAIVKRGLV